MIAERGTADLLVLVADVDIEQAVRGLLSRPRRMRIDDLSFEVRRHPNRDSGCRTHAVDFLRLFLGRCRRAMVVFDLHGCGSNASREETQQEVELQLRTNGWGGRSKAIVIEPEFEAWVWGRSSYVSEALGWDSRYDRLRAWLESQGLWPADRPKPPDPKRAMQRAMKQAGLHMRLRRSPIKFYELARKVDVRRCEDPAFGELRATLRDWFGATV